MPARHRHLRLVPSVDPAAVQESAECGRALRSLRQQAGLDIAELAVRAGTTEVAVVEFEAGRVVPAHPAFTTYLRALGHT